MSLLTYSPRQSKAMLKQCNCQCMTGEEIVSDNVAPSFKKGFTQTNNGVLVRQTVYQDIFDRSKHIQMEPHRSSKS